MSVCPSCGESFEEGGNFCEQCGSRMDETEKERRCPTCGACNEADAGFCVRCGERLSEGSKETESLPSACHGCGARAEGGRECSLCGMAERGALSKSVRVGLLLGGALLVVGLSVLGFVSVQRSKTSTANPVRTYQPQVVDDPTSSVAAKIDGETILRETFSRLLDQAKAPYQRKYGAEVFEGAKGQAMLGPLAQSTMDRLINRRLLLRAALRAGTPEVSEAELVIEMEKFRQKNGLSEQELEDRLRLDGRTPSDFMGDLREQVWIQRFVEAEIVGDGRDKEEQQALFSRWFSNLKTTTDITIFLSEARPTSASAGCGGGGGGCGGSKNCSGSCGSGVTQPLDPRIEAEAKEKGLAFYQAKGRPGQVVAKVSNYGCHIQVDILAGEEIVQSLTYSGGQIFEI
ncbi:MAG: SurA N-terminal domain-containing protein [Candidatus Latescibacterota bacterium]